VDFLHGALLSQWIDHNKAPKRDIALTTKTITTKDHKNTTTTKDQKEILH